MVFPRIQNPKTTTADTYAGDALNKIQEWLAGINIAATDSTNKPGINTDTRFHSGRLKLFDLDFSNELSFVTPALSTNANISFPVLLSAVADNEILFASVPQAIENKTINAAANTITNITNTSLSAGAAIGSGFGEVSFIVVVRPERVNSIAPLAVPLNFSRSIACKPSR